MRRPEMRLSLEQSMGVVVDGIRLGLRAEVIILFIKVVASEREPVTRRRRGGGVLLKSEIFLDFCIT